MAFWSRQNSGVPSELQPYYNAPVPGSSPAWIKWVVRSVVALIVILLLVLLVRWAWHELHNSSSPSTDIGTSTSNSPSTSVNSGNINASGPSSTSQPSNGSSSNVSSNAAANSNSRSATLVDTGPGDTVALFVGVSVVGAALYQVRMRRSAGTRP